MYKTIVVIAKTDCDTCHGTGYEIGISPESRLPCHCVLNQIPEDASGDIDFLILPASFLDPVILEPCRSNHERYKTMGIEFCPECGQEL